MTKLPEDIRTNNKYFKYVLLDNYNDIIAEYDKNDNNEWIKLSDENIAKLNKENNKKKPRTKNAWNDGIIHHQSELEKAINMLSKKKSELDKGMLQEQSFSEPDDSESDDSESDDLFEDPYYDEPEYDSTSDYNDLIYDTEHNNEDNKE